MGRQRTRATAPGSRLEAPATTPAPAADVGVARSAAEQELSHLQRTAGNRAAVALLARGQARLQVGAADDAYEREADAVAREVVASLRGSGPAGGVEHEQGAPLRRISRWAAPGSSPPEPEVGLEGGDLGGETEAAITSARSGGGRALPAPAREKFESAFGGVDLSGVRLHTGPEASDLNRRVAATAFTVGQDIFFSGPAPDTGSSSGQELLAHELAHTIQQAR